MDTLRVADWYSTPAPQSSPVGDKSLNPIAIQEDIRTSPTLSQPPPSDAFGPVISNTQSMDRREAVAPIRRSPANTMTPRQVDLLTKPTPPVPAKDLLPRPALVDLHPRRNNSDSSTTERSNGKPQKEHRMRKRETRHPKDSGSSRATEAPNISKGKSMAKKQKYGEARRKAKEVARNQPKRDPALDLVAGFTIPDGDHYCSVEELHDGMVGHLMGIVSEVGPGKTTKNGDFCKSFVVVDPSKYPQGLKIMVFTSRKDLDYLPSTKVGQGLLLRSIFMQTWQGNPQGVGRRDNFRWCGFDPATGTYFHSMPEKVPSEATLAQPATPSKLFFKPSVAELDYFVKISDWWRAIKEVEEKDREANRLAMEPLKAFISPRMRDAAISQLKAGQFSDCVVERK
ncbi:hypothetical protein M422DRAFT_51329 [Sphaerobolus stellatus SS14]|uniref:Telomeric single stranded DNA binding POT1/Cdc13 domain-containing protein n=1 Tax=Sphaerobolus stellatus (strain SS14) TaxID=990650 RepID=A0A0C9VDM9_SPHS4|nr:hypothetical protein M422DRAFT_51329 [Sphaerobolus stellatus SS14]